MPLLYWQAGQVGNAAAAPHLFCRKGYPHVRHCRQRSRDAGRIQVFCSGA
jgi:hypothetical protein